MRPSPPLQVTITRFGLWRVLILSSVVTLAVSVLTWLCLLHDDSVLASTIGRTFVGVVTAGCIAAAASLLRVVPLSLRWDSQCWHLGPAASIGHEPLRGRLRVAIDLGQWMLLRFDADAEICETTAKDPALTRHARWIPVQRSSIGQVWHALRCTVYSPRPEVGDRSIDISVPAAIRSHPAE